MMRFSTTYYYAVMQLMIMMMTMIMTMLSSASTQVVAAVAVAPPDVDSANIRNGVVATHLESLMAGRDIIMLPPSAGGSSSNDYDDDDGDESKKDDGTAAVMKLTKQMADEFLVWTEQHSKTYSTEQETLKRLMIWKDNDAFIVAHNTKEPPSSYTLGHNQFSDMTFEEFRSFNKLGPYSPGVVSPVPVVATSTVKEESAGNEEEEEEEEEEDYENVEIVVPSESSTTMTTATSQLRRRRQRQLQKKMKQDLPDSIDWIEKGAVVDVKNQGMCGSCWAFSAIVAIEGAHFLDTGKLVSLSEQELIDCDKLDLGCGGGLMDNAFLFDENSTGICSEEDYPYVMHKRWLKGCGTLKGECEPVEHTRVESFNDVENTVDGLMAAIAKQPVSVAIEADQQSFQFYKSGVFDDPECGNDLDHGVAAVGYGTSDDGKDYFKVRNSWGQTWGDHGYILMSRSSDNVNGTCGILGFASAPKLRDDK